MERAYSISVIAGVVRQSPGLALLNGSPRRGVSRDDDPEYESEPLNQPYRGSLHGLYGFYGTPDAFHL